MNLILRMVYVYCEQAARAAGMQKQYIVPAIEIALLVELYETGEGLAGVYRIDYYALLACHHAHRGNAR